MRAHFMARIDPSVDPIEGLPRMRAGDDAAATRARRVMQRLEAQRPAVNRQIENLQGQVEPDAP